MIPRQWVDNYTVGVNVISKKARETLAALLSAIDMEQDVATVREQVVQTMQGVCGTSTQGAAMLSAQFYNGIRQYELGETIDPTFESGREPEATEGSVRAFAQKLVDGKRDEFVGACLDRVDYEVKVAAAQTCVNNAERDPRKPKFARVPSGEETCDFCLMLASRGFVYHTEVTASHAHANCDCRIIPSWESEEVEGYDPDDLYRRWKGVDTGVEKHSALSEDSIKWPGHKPPIRNVQFKALRSRAESAGIVLQGFRHAGIDINAAERYIDAAAKVLDEYPELKVVDGKPLTLRLTGMHSNDFAYVYPDCDGWNVINVNRESLRELEALEREYEKLQAENWFVKGTTAESVIYHELGHIYQHVHGIDVTPILTDMFGVDKASLNTLLYESLSEYSVDQLDLSEVIPEAFSGYYNDRCTNEVAERIAREVLDK